LEWKGDTVTEQLKKAAVGVLYGAPDGALQRAIRAILKQGSRARRFSALFPPLQP